LGSSKIEDGYLREAGWLCEASQEDADMLCCINIKDHLTALFTDSGRNMFNEYGFSPYFKNFTDAALVAFMRTAYVACKH
jgi:hypothetical protein